MTAPSRGYSVVIGSYNRREQVAECVESVLGQTRAPEQVIVVDDGSTDGTADFLRTRYPNVCVVEQSVNRGRSIAVNLGLALATEDWICLLDDDDLWHREKLAEVDAYLDAHPDCAALNHPVWFFRPEYSKARTTAFGFDIDLFASNLSECHEAVATSDPSVNDFSYLLIHGHAYESLLAKNCGAYSSSVVRKDVLMQAGGLPPTLICADDWTMFLNVARIYEWHTIPRRLAFCRIHDGQSTNESDNATAMLSAHVSVWFGGRPFPEKRTPTEISEQLRRYQPVYRAMVQQFLWGNLRRGNWRIARDVRRLGRPLILKWTDWVLVHLPPRLTRHATTTIQGR